MGLYKIRHKQTGEIIEGNWEEICDYDKRVWILQHPPVKLPLAVVPFTKFGPHPDELGKPINKMSDLVGVYV